MERINPLAADSAANWVANNGTTRNGADSRGKPVNESGRQEFLKNLLNQFIYANIAAVYPPPPQVTAC